VNESNLIWGVGLILGALLLVFIEVFVPSGGLIAIASGAVAIAGIWQLFLYDTVWGVIGLVGVLIMVPVVVGFGLKMLPSTPIGKKMFFGEGSPENDQERVEREMAVQDSLNALVGVEGQAATDLRPVGVVRIEGRRFDALAEGGFIDAGTRVRVTVVEGAQLKVRAVS
jgi:membrane-bound serine protease (ClpP class)